MTVITLEYAKNLANKGFTNEQTEAFALENKRLLLLQWGGSHHLSRGCANP